MKLSYNWLSEFVKLDDIDPDEVRLKLTMSTAEIESVEEAGSGLEGVVVGRIVEVKRHPDSDHLFVTKVDTGKEVLNVISGAPNTRKDALVPVATIGTRLPGGVTVKKAKLRGVDSYGMVCSEKELGVSDDHSGLWILEGEGVDLSLLVPGTPLSKLFPLRDHVIEIDNKSLTNRPDLWGHYGFARELAAVFGRALKPVYPPRAVEAVRSAKGERSIRLEIRDPDLCPRYTAIMLDGIRVQKSPWWVRRRLSLLGVRPIYNIVDVTNYVMLEIGQPLHAFDARFIAESTIVVRRAGEGERFTTLDGTERSLTKETLLIADPQKAVAVAGVMGGLNSEIGDATHAIIIESANFNPGSIRRTMVRLGLRTEASNRFEKSLDPELTLSGIIGSAAMIRELLPEARICSPLADAGYAGFKPVRLRLDTGWAAKLLGVPVEKTKIKEILSSLSFGVHDEGEDVLDVSVPSFRATKDVSIPQDLVEEVGRIYGYGNISPAHPLITNTPPHRDEMVSFIRTLKQTFAGALALSEVYTYSYLEDKLLDLFYAEGTPFVTLRNPVSADMSRMRRSLIPGLYGLIERNAGFREELSVFEVGSIYNPEKENLSKAGAPKGFLPEERKTAAALILRREGDLPVFFELKGRLELLFRRLGVPDAEPVGVERAGGFVASLDLANLGISGRGTAAFNSARAALLASGETCFGIVAELNPFCLKKAGLDYGRYRAAVFELDLGLLLAVQKEAETRKKYLRIPRYPEVLLAHAIVVDEEVAVREVRGFILSCGVQPGHSILKRVELFDIYRGKPLSEGKKSLAFNFYYGSDERTLTEEESKRVHEKIAEHLKGRGWELRR